MILILVSLKKILKFYLKFKLMSFNFKVEYDPNRIYSFPGFNEDPGRDIHDVIKY